MYAVRPSDQERFLTLRDHRDDSPLFVSVGGVSGRFRERLREIEACGGSTPDSIYEAEFTDCKLAEAIVHRVLEAVGQRRTFDCGRGAPCPAGRHTEWFTPRAGACARTGRNAMRASAWLKTVLEVIQWVHDEAPGILKAELRETGRAIA